MPDYATITGFVQFEVNERELDNGDKVRDLTVGLTGVNAPRVRVTLWPEFADVDVDEGDFVAVDGTWEERTGQNKAGEKVTYRNVNARRIAVTKGAERAEREVSNKKKARSF